MKRILTVLLTLILGIGLITINTNGIKAEDNSPKPLTFTAKEDNARVRFKWLSGSNVEYKTTIGGVTSNWQSYTANSEVILDNIGDSVSFRANNIKTDGSNHFQTTNKVAASGDVTSLTNGIGGDVPLTEDECYNYMFYNCDSLVSIDDLHLPSTTLSSSCYEDMFSGCDGITSIPENFLPATNLNDYCYHGMFSYCNGLTTLPENLLKATTLSDYCYYAMFRKCENLKTLPNNFLSALSLAPGCYSQMFYQCTSLSNVPILPAEILADSCYNSMFDGCSNIKLSETKVGKYETPFILPSSEASLVAYEMFSNTGGTFTGTPSLNTMYYIQVERDPLTFTANKKNSTVTFKWLEGSNVKYKTNTMNDFATYVAGTPITLTSIGDSVSFIGTGVKTDFQYHFVMTGDIAASGDVNTLIDEQGGNVTLPNECYKFMFGDCDALTSIDKLKLPSTVATEMCYLSMFSNCTHLKRVPSGLLPATALVRCCYQYMFQDCTSLTNIPNLPATTLSEACYREMFNGCSSLKLSETKENNYVIPFKITHIGEGVSLPVEDMFTNTGGTFKGTPELNKQYYISSSSSSRLKECSNSSSIMTTCEVNVTKGVDDTIAIHIKDEETNPLTPSVIGEVLLSKDKSSKGTVLRKDIDYYLYTGSLTLVINKVALNNISSGSYTLRLHRNDRGKDYLIGFTINDTPTPDPSPSKPADKKDESCEKVIGPTWHWNNASGICEDVGVVGTATR